MNTDFVLVLDCGPSVGLMYWTAKAQWERKWTFDPKHAYIYLTREAAERAVESRHRRGLTEVKYMTLEDLREQGIKVF